MPSSTSFSTTPPQFRLIIERKIMEKATKYEYLKKEMIKSELKE